MYDTNNLDTLAFDLAKIYLRFYRRGTGHNLFSLSKIKGSKWWMPFFRTVSVFSSKEEWDAYRFVEAQFSDGLVYPSQLSTNHAWDNFLEYRKRIKEDLDTYVANSCATTFNFIKKWSKLKGYSRPDYAAFIHDQAENILRGAFSIHFFSILRPFYDFYNALPVGAREKFATLEDLEKKRVVIHSIKKLKEKLKEVLGDDFA